MHSLQLYSVLLRLSYTGTHDDPCRVDRDYGIPAIWPRMGDTPTTRRSFGLNRSLGFPSEGNKGVWFRGPNYLLSSHHLTNSTPLYIYS